MTMKNTTPIEIEATVKAFTGQCRRVYKLSISPNGTVDAKGGVSEAQ